MKFDWDISLENIRTVANGLKEMVSDIVFVGGATLGFYVDRDTATISEVRGSEDVDLVVEVSAEARIKKVLRNMKDVTGYLQKINPKNSL